MDLDIPPLFCPFASTINPAVAEAEASMLAFCRRHRLLDARITAEHLCRMRVAEFVARAYPDASLDRLGIILDWTVWAFLADDRADANLELSALTRRYDRYLRTLRGEARPREVVGPLHEVRIRILRAAGARTLERFVAAVSAWFDAMAWEVSNRVQALVPSMADYITVREFDVGMYTEFALFDVTHDTDQTDRIWDIPEIRTLMQVTSNLIAWSNDIYSYAKERNADDPHNLVEIFAREKRCSIERALAEVAIMHNREVDRFMRIKARLRPRLEAYEDSDRFVRMLTCWIRSNLDWSLRSARYALCSGAVVGHRPHTDAYRAVVVASGRRRPATLPLGAA